MADETQTPNPVPSAQGPAPTNPVPDLAPPGPAPVGSPPSVPVTPSTPATVYPIASVPTPTQGVQMPPPVTPQSNYAGFWIRFVATLIDGTILGVASNLIIDPILNLFGLSIDIKNVGGIGGGLFPVSDPVADPFTAFFVGLFALSIINIMIYSLVAYIYYVLLTWKWGQTIGKKVLALKVVNSQGDKPSFTQALIRETIGKFVSSVALGIGYLWVAFDKKKQGWHDKIAGTYVVKKTE